MSTAIVMIVIALWCGEPHGSFEVKACRANALKCERDAGMDYEKLPACLGVNEGKK